MNYQKIILVGNTTGNALLRTSKGGGITYATFSVGVSETKDRTIFFPIAVFGKRAEASAQYITKGRQVLVEGRIEVSKQGRFNVVADHMRLGPSTGQPEPRLYGDGSLLNNALIKLFEVKQKYDEY